MNLESSKARRVQRKSAKMAIYYLHELASTELAKEWPKRKVREDLIPDDRKVPALGTGRTVRGGGCHMHQALGPMGSLGSL